MIPDQEGIISTHLGERERERGQKNQERGQELGQEMTTVNLSYGQEGKEPVLLGRMKGLREVESTDVGNPHPQWMAGTVEGYTVF